MSFAFVFPGQGSQTVGMGKALADTFAPARAVFEEVDAALGEKLTCIIWEGPPEKLMLTENAQPALMAVSLAAMRVLQADAGVELARDARFVAGHSLGEYSALAAAGALSIPDTARLLRVRGRAMQAAVPVGAGAMAALLGLEFAKGKGARRAMLLPVSAPFHCALMQPAADAMAEALAKVSVKPPVVPLVANVLARSIGAPAEIVKSLIAQ